MNKFYIIEDSKIIELETVKNFAFMQKIHKGKVWGTLSDVPIPQGYELNGMEFIKTAETIELEKIAEIKSRLTQIDFETMRPLRAIQNGTGSSDDEAKINSLENEAEELRTELQEIGQ